MHYISVLLIFQNPASTICPVNHDYQILNGLCIPIMHSKSPVLDELAKGVDRSLQLDNSDIEYDDDDYSSDEDKFDDEQPL